MTMIEGHINKLSGVHWMDIAVILGGAVITEKVLLKKYY
jgi:hypothetical protein